MSTAHESHNEKQNGSSVNQYCVHVSCHLSVVKLRNNLNEVFAMARTTTNHILSEKAPTFGRLTYATDCRRRVPGNREDGRKYCLILLTAPFKRFSIQVTCPPLIFVSIPHTFGTLAKEKYVQHDVKTYFLAAHFRIMCTKLYTGVHALRINLN